MKVRYTKTKDIDQDLAQIYCPFVIEFIIFIIVNCKFSEGKMYAQRPIKEKLILSMFIPIVVLTMLYLIVTFHNTVLVHFTTEFMVSKQLLMVVGRLSVASIISSSLYAIHYGDDYICQISDHSSWQSSQRRKS